MRVQGRYFAAIAIGAGYAVSRQWMAQWGTPEQALEQDFLLLFLSGVLIGFALRPIAQRIYWYRSTCFFIVLLLLLGVGPLGKTLEQIVWKDASPDLTWFALTEICSSLLVALLTSLLIVPSQSQMTWARLGRCYSLYLNRSGMQRLFLSALMYCSSVILFKVMWNTPEMQGTLWERSIYLWEFPPWSGVEKIALLMLRGVLYALVLMPLLQILQGRRESLTFVLGTLIFILNSFVPSILSWQGAASLQQISELVQDGIRLLGYCYFLLWIFQTESTAKD